MDLSGQNAQVSCGIITTSITTTIATVVRARVRVVMVPVAMVVRWCNYIIYQKNNNLLTLKAVGPHVKAVTISAICSGPAWCEH